MRVVRQEFPYDVGFWKNIVQGMGSVNVLGWFMPFSGAPSEESAVGWEENGFEDAGKMWPPPDPDKVPRVRRVLEEEDGEREYKSRRDEVDAFRERQQRDLMRWENLEGSGESSSDGSGSDDHDDGYDKREEKGFDGLNGWTNSDGDRLRDYGVDEDAEVISDEDDIPLGELLRRRKARAYAWEE